MDLLPYKQKLKLETATFSLIEHPDALVASVYQVREGLSTFILKVCSREEDYQRECYFLEYFAGELSVVPRLLKLVPPETGIGGAILMECLPGSLLTENDLTEKLASEIGQVLAHIHGERVGGFGDLTLPDLLSNDPLVPFKMKFEEGLEECSGHLPSSLIEKCRHYLQTHQQLLDVVDGPCIMHRDFRPGNLLVDEGKLTGVIDWSSARGGFAEVDFCTLNGSILFAKPAIKAAFLEGYAQIRPVPHYEPFLELSRLFRAVASVGFTIKRGTWKSKNAAFYQANRKILEEI